MHFDDTLYPPYGFFRADHLCTESSYGRFAAYEEDLAAKPVVEASSRRQISMVHKGSFEVNGERRAPRIYACERGPELRPPET
jgi:hypothetical protein